MKKKLYYYYELPSCLLKSLKKMVIFLPIRTVVDRTTVITLFHGHPTNLHCRATCLRASAVWLTRPEFVSVIEAIKRSRTEFSPTSEQAGSTPPIILLPPFDSFTLYKNSAPDTAHQLFCQRPATLDMDHGQILTCSVT